MPRHGEPSAGHGVQGSVLGNSLNRRVRANDSGQEMLAMMGQFATMNTGSSQSRALPPTPAPASAPGINEATTLIAQFSEVRRPQAFDHEARPSPAVAGQTSSWTNFKTITRMFKMKSKPKNPPSTSHARTNPAGNTGNTGEESEEEDEVTESQLRPGANPPRTSLARDANMRDSGTASFETPLNPPNRVMSPGIAEEYVIATRRLGVPDVAPPQRAQTPIISRRRGRTYNTQYPESFRGPFGDA